MSSDTTIAKARRCFIVLCLMLSIFSGNAWADPCGMVPPIDVPEGEPGIRRLGLQQTYVFFRNGIETLVIHPGFEGNVEEFGMLIPFPVPPEIRKVSDNTFHHLKAAIDPPEVLVDLRPEFFGAMGMGGGMMGGYGGGGYGGSGGQMEIQRDETRVIKEEAVGMYDVAVLQAGSSAALERWMKENSYRYPKGMDRVCEDYIRERWCFVAVRARIGHKQLVDPQPGQREVDSKLQPGASFDGHVQAMGFRFKISEPVVPMRLSTYNEGDLRNVVYILAQGGVCIKAIARSMVVRQLSGDELIANLTQPLPLRILGGQVKDIPRAQRIRLEAQRDPRVHMQAAEDLFRGDLRCALNDRLSNREEELEKDLLVISERLGLRGEAIDRLHRKVTSDREAAESDAILQELSGMVLTVVDGDFPRDVLANQNLQFENFDLEKRLNSPALYDAKEHGPRQVAPKDSLLIEGKLSGLFPKHSQHRSVLNLRSEPIKVGGVEQNHPRSAGLIGLGCLIAACFGSIWILGKRRALFVAGGIAFGLCSGAADCWAQQEELPQKNAPTRTLVAQLGDADEASQAVEALVQQGKVSLRSLAHLILNSESQLQRGWAIVCLQDMGTEEAKELLKRLSKAKLPELEQTWVLAARVALINSVNELDEFLVEVKPEAALDRPIKAKLLQLLDSSGAQALASLIALSNSRPGLQPFVAKVMVEARNSDLAKVCYQAKVDATRRTAAAYLAGKAKHDDSVAATVIEQLRYSRWAEKVPWDGGPLFLPNLEWTTGQTRELFLQLSQWMLRAEREQWREVRQQIRVNLRDLANRSSDLVWDGKAVVCLNSAAIEMPVADYQKIAKSHELKFPAQLASHLAGGGEFEMVFVVAHPATLNGSVQVTNRMQFEMFGGKSRGTNEFIFLGWMMTGVEEDSKRFVTDLSDEGMMLQKVDASRVFPLNDSERMKELASVDGKYTKLLHEINAPGDRIHYGYYRDYGHYPAANEYHGHPNIEEGYWVYVYPVWYVWGNKHE